MDTTIFTSGIDFSDLNSFTVIEGFTDKAETIQLYMESESWIQVSEDGTMPKPEDTSEDWKITPMHMIDPKLQAEWKQARLWMMDPLDDALGDDAMPALCSSCNGVFWGDQMMSVAKTVLRLRDKHDKSINGMLGNVWEETEPNVLNKLRANRICKKCFTVAIEALANPWRENDYSQSLQVPMVQPNLPFQSIGGGVSSAAPYDPNVVNTTLTCSGMPSPPGGYNICYSDGNDCVSTTFADPDDDI